MDKFDPKYNGLVFSVLGVNHYNPPPPNDLSALSSVLPFGIPKTDENRWQDLPEEELGLGEKVLITKKLDGSSCTILSTPNGEVHVTSRSMDLKLDCCNNYTLTAKPVIPAVVEYAKKHNCIFGVRGEVIGEGINASKVNRDARGSPTFYMYGVIFPEENDVNLRFGRFGTKNHFLEINKELNINTVPIIGEEICTKDLLKKYVKMPALFGEGIVINWSKGSYKSKSDEYYFKL